MSSWQACRLYLAFSARFEGPFFLTAGFPFGSLTSRGEGAGPEDMDSFRVASGDFVVVAELGCTTRLNVRIQVSSSTLITFKKKRLPIIVADFKTGGND